MLRCSNLRDTLELESGFYITSRINPVADNYLLSIHFGIHFTDIVVCTDSYRSGKDFKYAVQRQVDKFMNTIWLMQQFNAL
jgi:hypothetical protein